MINDKSDKNYGKGMEFESRNGEGRNVKCKCAGDEKNCKLQKKTSGVSGRRKREREEGKQRGM